MRLRCVLLIEEGPAALKQIASVVGFAQAMQLPLTMVPEEEPRSDLLAWGPPDTPYPGEDAGIYTRAHKLLGPNDKMRRKEFVRALAKATGKTPKSLGSLVSRWIRIGVMVEVRP